MPMHLLPTTTHPIPSRPEPSKGSKLRIHLRLFDLRSSILLGRRVSPIGRFPRFPPARPLQPGLSFCLPGSRAAHLQCSLLVANMENMVASGRAS
ncbi:hypothetical protein N7481_007237 [Penicillium waksmanii]|uniref:uncharacterized protein n=1 Tax=Penicillium waksmanii TaxID=69791 RepID=UPI002549013A|nr:uncharacterized protein N7481_007237 [Penicillium waksmanii]KAJ5979939.1 hypothetical protein N7481_007237 [Penicillium waksmanii]